VTLDSPEPGRVTLTGPATYIGTVEIDVELGKRPASDE
jgi:hypothetical protein